MIDFSHFNSIYELTSYFTTEERCKRYIFESRWEKHDVVCPFCGQHHCTTRTDGRFHCPHCKANFSVLVGTIFENTKISLVKWFMAMYFISCHKKGISSVQLATDIKVTQKTAWYILHKVRTLYKQDDSVVLEGLVECDEMYLGGRETNKHECKKTEKTQGRSTKTKTPIFGMTMVWKDEIVNEKTGEIKEMVHTYEIAKKVPNTQACTLIPIIEHFVAEGSTVVTDELSAYSGLSAKYNHVFVHHGQKEFTIGSYSTNGIEGFWGHFKRIIFGTYHFVGKKYLDRYIDEAVFRFNTKEMNESDRFSYMFEKAIGKVQYKDVKISVLFILKRLNMKQKIRINESQLRDIIAESVKIVLNELDWKSYANAAKKRNKQGKIDSYEALRRASEKSFNDEYGYNDEYDAGITHRGDRKVYLHGIENRKDDTPRLTASKDDTYPSYYGANKWVGSTLDHTMNGDKVHGYHHQSCDDGYWNSDNPEDFEFGPDEVFKGKYNSAKREFDNYNNDNYDYIPGSGWCLKK